MTKTPARGLHEGRPTLDVGAYDRSSYIIAVYIKNGENGKLVPQVIAEKNDGKKCGELMFYNSYNKRNI
ncbi:hypothetical protein GMD08_10065 [[Ruminococcus] torques]|nr:hypothetical protein [[Ruminococcus] torques]